MSGVLSGHHWDAMCSLPKADGMKWTNVDPCNLFIGRDYRGFREMLNALEAKLIEPHRLRWDASGRDGIHVNQRDYISIVGLVGGGRE